MFKGLIKGLLVVAVLCIVFASCAFKTSGNLAGNPVDVSISMTPADILELYTKVFPQSQMMSSMREVCLPAGCEYKISGGRTVLIKKE